jgi:hypothetical protein
VNQLVLLMTESHVLSITRSSCYRQPKYVITFCFKKAYGALNFTNVDSFGILLTAGAFFHAVKKAAIVAFNRALAIAFVDRKKQIGYLNRPVFKRTLERSCISAKGASSLDCAFPKVGRKERKDLSRLSGVVGFGCLRPKRERLSIASDAGHRVAGAPPDDSALTRAMRLVVVVARKLTTEVSFKRIIVSCWADFGHQSRPARRHQRTPSEDALTVCGTRRSWSRASFPKKRRGLFNERPHRG